MRWQLRAHASCDLSHEGLVGRRPARGGTGRGSGVQPPTLLENLTDPVGGPGRVTSASIWPADAGRAQHTQLLTATGSY